MKKLVKHLICSCIALAGGFTAIQAQDLAMIHNKFTNDALSNTALATELPGAKIPAATVNAKVLHAFYKSYKNTTDMSWFAVRKNYLVTFNWDGLKAHAMLAKNGNIYYSVRSGTENTLPAEGKKLIKANYVDYTIGKVAEVNVDGQNAWLVNLENETDLIIARVQNGTLDEVAHYKTHPQSKIKKRAHVEIPAQ